MCRARFAFALLAFSAASVLAGVSGAAAPGPVLVSASVSGLASGNAGSVTSDKQRPSRRLVSLDGRYVVFLSDATNLTKTPDANSSSDVFRRDLTTGSTELVSLNAAGSAAANGASHDASLSADGRYVVFLSTATNVTAGVAAPRDNVYLRDVQERKTVLVSASPAGAGGDAFSLDPVITPDGRYVAFGSLASNLVAGFIKGLPGIDIFERDLQAADPAKATELVSLVPSQAGQVSTGGCEGTPAISADGRVVAFTTSTDFLAGDRNGTNDVFVRDRSLKKTELVSVNPIGTGSGAGSSSDPVMSADGRYVAFNSTAPDLTTGATIHPQENVFVRDRTSRTTVLASIDPTGTADGDGASQGPTISADGRYVAFISLASDLAAGFPDANGAFDILLRDLPGRTTMLVSVDQTGARAANGRSTGPVLSADGRYVAFASEASDMADNDVHAEVLDVFRRDLVERKTLLVSVNGSGTSGNGHSGVSPTAISGDGALVLFSSLASDLDSHDTNGSIQDVFAARPGPAATLEVTDPLVSPLFLPAAGGKVTISVHVTSPSAITLVRADIPNLIPGGPGEQVALSHGVGSLYSGSHTFPANPSFTAQTYHLHFSARDAAGRQLTVEGKLVVVAGRTAGPAPVITNCRLDPARLPNAGGSVTVSADVTGANGISTVSVSDSRPSPESAVMTRGSGNRYVGVVKVGVGGRDDTTLTFTITARDQAGLVTRATCGTVLLDGVKPPVIANCQVTPSHFPFTGGTLKVSVDVTAPSPIYAVQAELYYDGVRYSFGGGKLAHTTGSSYSGSFPVGRNPTQFAETIKVRLIASTEAGGYANVDCAEQPTQDGPYAAIACTVSPVHLPWSGGTLQITAKVTAPAGSVIQASAGTAAGGDLAAARMRRMPHRKGWYRASLKIGRNSQRTRRVMTARVSVSVPGVALGDSVECAPGPVTQAAKRRAKR